MSNRPNGSADNLNRGRKGLTGERTHARLPALVRGAWLQSVTDTRPHPGGGCLSLAPLSSPDDQAVCSLTRRAKADLELLPPPTRRHDARLPSQSTSWRDHHRKTQVGGGQSGAPTPPASPDSRPQQRSRPRPRPEAGQQLSAFYVERLARSARLPRPASPSLDPPVSRQIWPPKRQDPGKSCRKPGERRKV
jgi:hypothetical protein